MKIIQKLQIELNKVETINEKQKLGELSPLKAQLEREKIRDKIIDIIETEEYVLGK